MINPRIRTQSTQQVRFTRSYVFHKLQNSGIIDPKAFNTDLFVFSKSFFKRHILIEVSNNSAEEIVKYIETILRAIGEEVEIEWQSQWIKLMLVHAGIQELTKQTQHHQNILDCLMVEADQIYRQSLRKTEKKTLKKDSSHEGFLNRSFGRLKSTFSLTDRKKSVEKIGISNDSMVKMSEASETQIQSSILEYSLYIKKLIQDFNTVQEYRKLEYSESLNIERSVFKNCVWKLINILKKQKQVFKNFRHVTRFHRAMPKFTYSTVNFLASDTEHLYVPIMSFILAEKSKIENYYQNNVLPLKINKRGLYDEKMEQLANDQNLIEVKIIIEEIAEINENINYLFNDSTHYRYIRDAVPPQNFVCNDSKKLDHFFEIVKSAENSTRRVKSNSFNEFKNSKSKASFALNASLNRKGSQSRGLNTKKIVNIKDRMILSENNHQSKIATTKNSSQGRSLNIKFDLTEVDSETLENEEVVEDLPPIQLQKQSASNKEVS